MHWSRQRVMVWRRNTEGPLLPRTDSTNGQQKEPAIKYLARKQLDSNCLQIEFKYNVPHLNDQMCLEICKSHTELKCSICSTVSSSWLQTMTQNCVIASNQCNDLGPGTLMVKSFHKKHTYVESRIRLAQVVASWQAAGKDFFGFQMLYRLRTEEWGMRNGAIAY